MKTLSSLLIIFIFTILTLNSPPSSAAEVYNDCDKFVCDQFGAHVKSNKPYRIGPPLKSNDESYLSIKLESTIVNHTCPLNGIVVKETGYVDDYFKITPIVPTVDGRLTFETPFSISTFEKKNGPCNKTDGYLRTTQGSKRLNFWHLTGNGKFNTPSSCFQFVVKYPLPEDDVPSYVLQNCPGKCGRSRTEECFGVGNRTEGGYNYLTTGRDLSFELLLREKEEYSGTYDA